MKNDGYCEGPQDHDRRGLDQEEQKDPDPHRQVYLIKEKEDDSRDPPFPFPWCNFQLALDKAIGQFPHRHSKAKEEADKGAVFHIVKEEKPWGKITAPLKPALNQRPKSAED
jgi:hypothetical protein